MDRQNSVSRRKCFGRSWHVSAKFKYPHHSQGSSESLENGYSKEAESSRNRPGANWGGTDGGNCYFSPLSSAYSFSDQRGEPLVKPSGEPKMLTPDHASETSVKLDK